MSAAATGDDVDALFATIDRKDTAGFAGFLTDDATIRFGSAPAVTGRDNIVAMVDGFFAAIRSLRHVIHFVAATDERLICEGEVTYERHDGSSVTLPFANVMERNGAGERIRHYKVYADYGPLWAAAD